MNHADRQRRTAASPFNGDVRYAHLQQFLLAFHHVDESDRHADDQCRPQTGFLDQPIEFQQRDRRIAEYRDAAVELFSALYTANSERGRLACRAWSATSESAT